MGSKVDKAMENFKCECGNQVQVSTPVVRVYNFPEVSGMFIMHDKGIRCTCGKQYIPLLQEMKPGVVGLVWRKLKVTLEPADNQVTQ